MGENTYTNNNIGLEITKPNHWEYMPGAWFDYSKIEIEKIGQMIEEKLVSPTVFAMMYRPVGEELDVYPTVQCKLSYHPGVDLADGKKILVEQLMNTYEKCEVLEDTDDFLISGKRCTSIKIRARAKYITGKVIDFRSQLIIVAYPQYFLLISFAGPAEGKFTATDDLISIMSSLRLKY